MRTLVITRGLPGSGKSTFIRVRGWAPYTIEPDALRLLHRGPEMQVDGCMAVSSKADSAVWKQVYALLEGRMAEGAFTVVDATHLYPQSLTPYRKLAERYRYHLYVLDFTGVPLDELLRRNAGRGLHRVPEDVLLRMARRADSMELPRWVRVLKTSDWEELLWRPLDLDSYSRILHIGDVHGCYTTLRTLLPETDPLPDTFYIFHGDLVDRGAENAAVVEFLSGWVGRPNVVVLEGNHEAALRAYAGMEGPAPAEYELHTKSELEAAGIPPADAGSLYRRTWQCCHYTYHGRTVFACHGGVPGLAGNPLYINTRQLIQGVGGYGHAEKVARAWDSSMPPAHYLVHGHRNRGGLPVQASGRVFNLEGQVEFGGCLRAVELTPQGFRPLEIPNPVPAVEGMQRFTPWLFPANGRPAMPESAPVAPIPSRTDYPELVSIAPARDSDQLQTCADMEACAVFKNKVSGEIVVRGYDAIPSIYGARPCFPVTAYLKENGFLGLAGYDHRNDRLVLTTRRSSGGPLISLFRKHLGKRLDLEVLADYLRKSRTTLAFEVIDGTADPHIIPNGPRADVILMDEIRNTEGFCSTTYNALLKWSRLFPVKKRERVFNNDRELWDFLKTNESREIEGFVLEDAEGRLFFHKTSYYYRWWMRRHELQSWRKKFPERTEVPADDPFLLWAHDYLTSHPEESGRAINFHVLRSLYWKGHGTHGNSTD